VPKKIIFESGVFQFAAAAMRRIGSFENNCSSKKISEWVAKLSIENCGHNKMLVRWKTPEFGEYQISLTEAKFYKRQGQVQKNKECSSIDEVAEHNERFFDKAFNTALITSGLLNYNESQPQNEIEILTSENCSRIRINEADFHNEWASNVDSAAINVQAINTACTAPEMRFIIKELGSLHGKKILDIGCGLGEASVFFALQGGQVTATDLSPGMLSVTRRLAEINNVYVQTVLSASERLVEISDEPFDIIYAGNILHHADIDKSMRQILSLLKEGGTFVSWDPVAYNPLINIYRKIAKEVRTKEEHPLKLSDIKKIRKYFSTSQITWFWLTCLIIFVVMFAIQRRNPNQERFWKKVIEEADRWQWIYMPLERLDQILIKLFPFLGPLCWNVVIIGKK
jgi:2-polyprenyl-3-methyl-5-hydroxy-6-metoxy-1,4-benzoquinol methylase